MQQEFRTLGHAGRKPIGIAMDQQIAAIAHPLDQVAGALAAPRLMQRLALGIVIAIGPISGFVAALVMMLTIVIPSGWLAGLSFFLMGAGPTVWVVSTTTLRQTVTPGHLLGRVSSINALAYGARPIGAGIGALVGGFWGPDVCLAIRRH